MSYGGYSCFTASRRCLIGLDCRLLSRRTSEGKNGRQPWESKLEANSRAQHSSDQVKPGLKQASIKYRNWISGKSQLVL